MIRTTRQAILQQKSQHLPRKGTPLQILIDLTTLEKCGKFFHLGNPTDDPNAPDPWVRVLNGKRGLHLVVLYLVIGQWRVPWSFRVWRGKGYPSPSQLACALVGNRPSYLKPTQDRRCAGRYGVWHRGVSSGSAKTFKREPWWGCAAIVNC